jgi:hypothetical protein
MGLSGTVILCDQVYQAQGGKYVIAGTFTTLDVRVADLRKVEHRVDGLSVYMRIRPERIGNLTLELLVRDESRGPWDAPMQRLSLDVPVTERNLRLIECGLVTPPFQVRIEGPPTAAATGSVMLRYSIELRADGEIVATTPFDLRFTAGQPGENRPL